MPFGLEYTRGKNAIRLLLSLWLLFIIITAIVIVIVNVNVMALVFIFLLLRRSVEPWRLCAIRSESNYKYSKNDIQISVHIVCSTG